MICFAKDHTLWEILGIRWEGIVAAIFLPLILTMILFLGPLTMDFLSGIWVVYLGNFLYVYMSARHVLYSLFDKLPVISEGLYTCLI